MLESTYATTVRDSKRCRERDFLKKVHDCIDKVFGGRGGMHICTKLKYKIHDWSSVIWLMYRIWSIPTSWKVLLDIATMNNKPTETNLTCYLILFGLIVQVWNIKGPRIQSFKQIVACDETISSFIYVVKCIILNLLLFLFWIPS